MAFTNLSTTTLTAILRDAVDYKPRNDSFGIGWFITYPNGYGLDLAKNQMSYGHQVDLWELAVCGKKDNKWDLVYDTPITNDVLGWLSEDEVLTAADAIRSLPEKMEKP